MPTRIIKVKIYARSTKTKLLKQSLGNTRFVWNKLLELNIEKYKKEHKFIFEFDMNKYITQLKKEYPFLNLTFAKALQQISRKLDRSLKSFLKHRKKGAGFPKFKKKSRYEGILIIPQGISIKGRKLRIPRVGWFSIKDKITKKEEWNNIKNTVKQVWVKQEPDGYYAYIVYNKNFDKKNKNDLIIGIDVGIKSTITLSNGKTLSLNKERIMQLFKKISILQSKIDIKKNINKKRKINNSKRINELIRRRDKIMKKIKNIRYDFYYKIVNYILNNHEYVVIEDLNLAGLNSFVGENKKVSKKVHTYLRNISLNEFFKILNWKAELYDRKIIKVNPRDTSKTCSNCGYINHNLKLSDRIFKCPKCGLNVDRDLNASINILNRGLEQIAPSSGHGEYMREMVKSVLS